MIHTALSTVPSTQRSTASLGGEGVMHKGKVSMISSASALTPYIVPGLVSLRVHRAIPRHSASVFIIQQMAKVICSFVRSSAF